MLTREQFQTIFEEQGLDGLYALFERIYEQGPDNAFAQFEKNALIATLQTFQEIISTQQQQIVALSARVQELRNVITCLKIPSYPQQIQVGCLPAALQMVLAYWGYDISQQDLIYACGTDPRTGSNLDGAIRAVTAYGLTCKLWCAIHARNSIITNPPASVQAILNNALTLDNTDDAWDKLQEAVGNGKPVIAIILPNHNVSRRFHAVVVCGFTDDIVFYKDPDEQAARQPISCSKSDFLDAWQEVYFAAIAIPY